MGRVSLYVDGYNFYYSTRNHYKPGQEQRGYSLSGLCWCDFRALIERNGWLRPGEELVTIKYFTAPVTESVDNPHRPGEPGRQQLWLDALRTVQGLEVIEGFHRRQDGPVPGREEKQTDVNLAIELVLDALRGQYDRAIVLSGDTDEIPAVLTVACRLAKKRDVLVLLPVGHQKESYVARLQSMTSQLRERGEFDPMNKGHVGVVPVCEQNMANSLFPYERTRCPAFWRLPARWLEKHCSPVNRPDQQRLRAVGGSRLEVVPSPTGSGT
jgi:uncharacterized LabA/DUF88 family protein